MEILLKRVARKPTYTIGRLYINGEKFCDTIEDTDRDLNHNGVFDNGEKKIPNLTAIPNGRYKVTMNVKSPKFSQKAEYKWCDGFLPRLIGVPSFEGILIHAGSSEKSSSGCIIVGKNTIVGRVTESMETCKKLYPILREAAKKEEIWITVE